MKHVQVRIVKKLQRQCKIRIESSKAFIPLIPLIPHYFFFIISFIYSWLLLWNKEQTFIVVFSPILCGVITAKVPLN